MKDWVGNDLHFGTRVVDWTDADRRQGTVQGVSRFKALVLFDGNDDDEWVYSHTLLVTESRLPFTPPEKLDLAPA